MKQEDFEKLVKGTIEVLPEKIRKKLENLAICIEKRPTKEQLKRLGARYGGFLLGLYEGIPQTKWGKGFGMILPDKITIFQEPIEKFSSSNQEIKELVKNVILHEIAHHFGFNEKEIKKLEPGWKEKYGK